MEKGVEMPDGQVCRLPAPTMAEGLNAVQQTAVLTKTATLGKTTLQQFLDKAFQRPVTLKVGKIPSKMGDDVIRTVNVGLRRLWRLERAHERAVLQGHREGRASE